MSVFTNPPSAAPEQATAYIRAVLDLLGDRDPVGVLGTTANELHHAIDGMSPEEISLSEAPGKWSAAQVLRHLADSEIVWAFRLRMVLAQDRPSLPGYDQEAWVDRLDAANEDAADSLAEFAILRRGNLKLLERASDADLDRVSVHSERGEESARHMARLYAGHDLVHLRQLRRIRAGVSSR